MGASVFSKGIATFLHGRQCVDGSEQFERAKSPKKQPTQKDRATKRLSGRSLLTQGDIEAAVSLCEAEGRSAWLLACAAMAREAEQRGDVHAFASAVVELVDALRQSERRSGKIGPVARAIQDTKARHPSIGAEAAIAMLIEAGRAGYVSLSDDLLIGGKRIQRDSFIRTFRRT